MDEKNEKIISENEIPNFNLQNLNLLQAPKNYSLLEALSIIHERLEGNELTRSNPNLTDDCVALLDKKVKNSQKLDKYYTAKN